MSRGIGIGTRAWQVNIFVLNHINVKRVVFQLRIIILVSGLDGGMQSSAKDLYWFWWIMSGYLLGPRILSLLLVLCCSTKAIIFCLRSLSESIHKWILGISSFSYIVKSRKTFLARSNASEKHWFNLLEGNSLVKLRFFKKTRWFINVIIYLLPKTNIDKKEFIEPLEN